MPEAAFHPASYRDPAGHIFERDGRIFRTVSPDGAADFDYVRESGVLADFERRGWTVETQDLSGQVAAPAGAAATYVLEHRRLPFISYPYEWPFPALKAAALLHLDLHLAALAKDVTLSDASAYNIQFDGARPVFIDILSLRRYREGEFWVGQRQFCEQFLNPLLLRATLGISHNSWYRGSLEGIGLADMSRLLPLRHRLSWRALSNIVLPARLEARARAKPTDSLGEAAKRKLPKAAYRYTLTQLRRWIEGLKPADTGPSVWGDYATANSYCDQEQQAKRRFVAEFVEKTRPKTVWDLGCNSGDYSLTALDAGAETVIGFDLDQLAIEKAFFRAEGTKRRFLPLIMDAANPSPDQGWRQGERAGLDGRTRPDAVLCLAFEHHLALGRNLPLPQVADWITGLGRSGVIEFVQKSDPTVQRMLALREDIFADYGEEAFAAALSRFARIVRTETVSEHNRRLYWFERETGR
ncbi:MAG: 50S ribosomal protein L11 methyltransferase [Dongiaceae bacterium]